MLKYGLEIVLKPINGKNFNNNAKEISYPSKKANLN